MRSTKYDAARLAPLVAGSTSISEVIRKLGLVPNGGNHRMITARVRLARLDTSHFTQVKRNAREVIEAVPLETLVELVGDAISLAQVLGKLGLPLEGRPHHELTARLRREGIDVSHLRAARWARGETKETHPSIAKWARKLSMSDAEVFVESSPMLGNGRGIIRRLVAMGWRYECQHCGISEWRGAKLVLHLDHINGNHTDNRLLNLRLLCPNCHSQTPTYCGKAREELAFERTWPCYTNTTRAWRNWLTRRF